MQGGIILIYFQDLITNLLQLISLLCPQLLFFCHRFIFLWKSERHQGSPWKSSGVELVSQMPHYWSSLQAYLVVYVLHSNHLFCSNPLLLWKWFSNTGLLLSLNCLPRWVTGTTWFTQHRNCPNVSGQALFSKYQKVLELQRLFQPPQGLHAFVGKQKMLRRWNHGELGRFSFVRLNVRWDGLELAKAVLSQPGRLAAKTSQGLGGAGILWILLKCLTLHTAC